MRSSDQPAFPHASEHGSEYSISAHPGMTLRDYFAAQVMQGLLACPREFVGVNPKAPWPDRAKLAYTAADAMLKAREA